MSRLQKVPASKYLEIKKDARPTPSCKPGLAFTNNAQIAKNNMTAGHATRKRTSPTVERDGFFFFASSQMADGCLAKPKTATVSAVYIDTTCQFSLWQVAGGRRVVSCGFAGVTRAAVAKRTSQDARSGDGRRKKGRGRS